MRVNINLRLLFSPPLIRVWGLFLRNNSFIAFLMSNFWQSNLVVFSLRINDTVTHTYPRVMCHVHSDIQTQ